MKSEILKLLKQSNDYISGEEMCRMLGVSRTAVWKNINALKQEGYLIESSSKRGYKFIKSPDVLSPAEVLPVLNTAYIGRNIMHFDSIDSTNNVARTQALQGCDEGLMVVAEEQTAGRGRLGRRWTTPKSTSIAFTLVLRPRIKPTQAPGITLVMGTAVCRAVRKVTSLEAGIKWPNDIIINNKKVCGILTEMNGEMDAVNYIIAGVGINVNVKEFPEEIKDVATSLYIEKSCTVSRKDILTAVLLEFEELYDIFKEKGLGSIIDEFKSYSVTLGKPVRVISINESFQGEAVDITDEGLLVVRLQDGEERKVISGDVSVRGISGYL